MEYEVIIDQLLDMNPDPIPRFILLKEFKHLSENSMEYQNLYDEVCSHMFVQKIANAQNERGFWPPFHGTSEGIIRKLLSYGLGKEHNCLMKASEYLVRVLEENEKWDQFEKQDNPLWWPKAFVPLVSAAILSLIDSSNEILIEHRKRWSTLANEGFTQGVFDRQAYASAHSIYFGFKTKRVIEPYNYYIMLLLAPDKENKYVNDVTDYGLVRYYLKEAYGMYYVYNNRPGDCIPIDTIDRDSRDFWNWIRSLSIISQYSGWKEYEQIYTDWIMSQRNTDGLWEFPKKFGYNLSNVWKGKNKTIDSSIYVLKLLMNKRGY